MMTVCQVSNLVSRELEAESIVVFDEAHNIDNVCIEALSVTLDRKALEESAKSVNLLQKRVSDMKASDSQRLAKEVRWDDLIEGGIKGEQRTQLHSHSSSILYPYLSCNCNVNWDVMISFLSIYTLIAISNSVCGFSEWSSWSRNLPERESCGTIECRILCLCLCLVILWNAISCRFVSNCWYNYLAGK